MDTNSDLSDVCQYWSVYVTNKVVMTLIALQILEHTGTLREICTGLRPPRSVSVGPFSRTSSLTGGHRRFPKPAYCGRGHVNQGAFDNDRILLSITAKHSRLETGTRTMIHYTHIPSLARTDTSIAIICMNGAEAQKEAVETKYRERLEYRGRQRESQV